MYCSEAVERQSRVHRAAATTPATTTTTTATIARLGDATKLARGCRIQLRVAEEASDEQRLAATQRRVILVKVLCSRA